MRRSAPLTALLLFGSVGLGMTTAFAAGLDVHAGNLQVFSMDTHILPFDGSFVIGDQNAAVGSSVTFWGTQWSQDNVVSGGAAPSSFKGYANDTTTDPPSCQADWSNAPANSSSPPASVPTYMPVIVTSSVAKTGSSISGNTVHVVLVKTNAGYSTGPGHTGTATVVAVLC